MKITLFGATGSLGQELLKQGLAKQHLIKTFVRSPDKIKTKHDLLEMIQADAIQDSQDSFAEKLAGSDAVISALGTGMNLRITKLYSTGTTRIVL